MGNFRKKPRKAFVTSEPNHQDLYLEPGLLPGQKHSPVLKRKK